MAEFGKYTLKYKPPTGAAESKVKMEITSEATLPQMLEFFTDFLKASGYCIDDDKELVFERKAPDFSQDFWAEDGFSVTGNPTASGDTITFGSCLPGGLGNDVISFGAAQFAGMWGGLKDDTITLG